MDQENCFDKSNTDLFRDWKFYSSNVDAHFEHLFPDMETNVCHEIASYPTHIDVFIKNPSKKTPYYVLFTAGMSTLAMTLPDRLQKERAGLERAELFVYLSKNFNMNGTLGSALHTLPLEKSWPIHILQALAKFPYENRTWLGNGHVIGPYNEPVAPGTKQCGVVLLQLLGDYGQMIASDDTVINLYGVVPIYREEIEYSVVHNSEEWKKFLENLPIMVDLLRPPLC